MTHSSVYRISQQRTLQSRCSRCRYRVEIRQEYKNHSWLLSAGSHHARLSYRPDAEAHQKLKNFISKVLYLVCPIVHSFCRGFRIKIIPTIVHKFSVIEEARLSRFFTQTFFASFTRWSGRKWVNLSKCSRNIFF